MVAQTFDFFFHECLPQKKKSKRRPERVRIDLQKMSSDVVAEMIKSGNYKLLLDVIKGFRNGFVYGCKVRAPHALVMTLLFNRGTLKEMWDRIYRATKTHGMNLGKTAFTFKLLHGLLAKLLGGRQPWHSAVAGFVCGYLFWGDQNPVNVQVNMYLLSRIISALLFVLISSNSVQLPANSFRLYAAVMWSIVMWLFFNHSGSMQNSLAGSMKYIYVESDQYSGLRDLLLVNNDKTI